MVQQPIKKKEIQISFKTILVDVILFSFIITGYLSLIAFSGETACFVMILRRHLNRGIILLMYVHLCLSAGEWIGEAFLEKDRKKAGVKIIIYLILLAALSCFFLQKMPGLTIESFYTVIGIYLVAFSRSRDFRRTVTVFLAAYAAAFLTAVTGLVFGYTTDSVKITDYGVKHAFGMVHPNTAARTIFILVFGMWYLYLQKNKKAAWVLFLGTAAFLAATNRCRTIILLMLAFPLLYRACSMGRLKNNREMEILITLFPMICFGITLLLCIPINLIHSLTYDNALFSIGERFVQAGIALRKYGLPLTGHSIDTSGAVKMMVDGEKIALFVMDNAFISYGVMRGLIWLIPCVCLFCLANQLALKESDYALVVFGILMGVFSILERRGLDPTFNLLLFFPLSATGKKGWLACRA